MTQNTTLRTLQVSPLRLVHRKAIWVPLIWTAGIFTIWGIAQLALNPGVSEAAIQECREEGFFPPDECEDALQALEDEEEPVVGIPLLLILWFAGLFLLSIIWFTERQPADSN